MRRHSDQIVWIQTKLHLLQTAKEQCAKYDLDFEACGIGLFFKWLKYIYMHV